MFIAFVMPTGQAAYTCFGQEATIVGTSGFDAELVGTDRPDVIVALSGYDEIDGNGGNNRICVNGGDDLNDEFSGGGRSLTKVDAEIVHLT